MTAPHSLQENGTTPREDARERADADDDHHRDRLIDRVMRAIGPAYDGAAELNNRAFAQRLVAALLALRVIHDHARSTEQDQPKKEDAQREQNAPQEHQPDKRITPKGPTERRR